MPDIVYVNEEDGIKRVMNNAALYVKLLAKFKNDTNMKDLVGFVSAGDWEKAQTSVHTIKGIAANLSLTELYNQSLDVETQIKGKSIKQESLENIQKCFNETLIAIEGVIAQNA